MTSAAGARLLSGYNEELTETLEDVRTLAIQSISLYLRNYTASTEFDRQTGKWVKTLTAEGEAGVLLRVGGSRVFVLEVSEKQGGLWFQESEGGSLRFDVEPFSVVRIIHGPGSCELVLEYLDRVKHRLYSEDTAIRPRDFAVDLFDWVASSSRGAGARVTDLSEKLFAAYLKEDYPPRTRAPN